MQESYAIFRTGGKQYRVAVGDVIDVELFTHEGDAPVEFQDVLFLRDKEEMMVGGACQSASVLAKVLGEVRGPKVVSYKYKKRKNCRRKVGHRQDYKRIKILEFRK